MIIRPRLSDYYDVPLLQSEVDFAIPFIDEDIPLYVDPFLMWKSPSQMDNMLHLGIMQAINQLGYMYCSKEKDKAITWYHKSLLQRLWWYQPRHFCMVGTTTSCTTAIPGTRKWQKAQVRNIQFDAHGTTD